MSSINENEYQQKYGTDHATAAKDYQATKIYIYTPVHNVNAKAYKMICSENEEAAFLRGQFILDPKLIWTQTD